MSTKSISVYQAMVDLKIMKKQFESMMDELHTVLVSGSNPYSKKDNIMNIPFVSIKTRAGKELGDVKIDELTKGLQSNFDKYNHLFKNIEAYSSAIAQSNAVTKITIGGVEYTIAEALKKKELSDRYAEFLQLIKAQVSLASYSVATKNSDLESKWLDTLKTISNDGELKLDDAFIEKQKNEFYDNNTFELLDPMSHSTKIDSMIEAHQLFVGQIDTELTSSNVRTIIEIELED